MGCLDTEVHSRNSRLLSLRLAEQSHRTVGHGESQQSFMTAFCCNVDGAV